MIHGNILYAGLSHNKTQHWDREIVRQSHNTTQQWDTGTEIVRENLLISTNESVDCNLGSRSCLVKESSANMIWLPKNIPGVLHFHQINTSHIVVIPSGLHCLHIIERIFDKLTTRDINVIGECYSRGRNDGSNPLFAWPTQSLSDNRNREILYVIDQGSKAIRMVNIATKTVGRGQIELTNTDVEVPNFWNMIQAENSTLYISVGALIHSLDGISHTIMSMDLIPPKYASNKYSMTFNLLIFHNQQNSSTAVRPPVHQVSQMTLLSNHTFMIMEQGRNGIKSINMTSQTVGHINRLPASFLVDNNKSSNESQRIANLIYYTWVNDEVYIAAPMSTYRLTLQQMLQLIYEDYHHGYSFNWKPCEYPSIIVGSMLGRCRVDVVGVRIGREKK